MSNCMSNFRTLPCVMCGKEATSCVEYSLIHADAQVCGRCAEIVANVYAKKHTDKWLTWPSDIQSTDTRTGRRKISADVRKFVMERDSYRCVKCTSFIDLQIDHVYPYSKGGSDDLDNLQTLCAICNNRKHNKVDE